MLSSILTLALAVAAAGFHQPDEGRPVVVSGRVVDAASGRPIPGVVVTPAGSAVVATAASPLPPRALTNGQGFFVLRGLRKGTVFFTAAKSGYADATYNQRRPGGSGQGIRIDDGQRVADVEIRMWRHASISGTVVDEAGDPAVGVRVQAFQRGFVAGRKRYTPGATATTDDRGVYRIARLTPGDYAIGIPATQAAIPTEVMDVFFGASGGGSEERRREVSRELNALGTAVVPAGSQYAVGIGDQTLTLPPGTLMPSQDAQGRLTIYPTLFYPAAGSVAQATAIALRSGEERGSIDLQMRPVRAARVSGMAMGPDGPASNVGVRLVPVADDLVEALDVATTLTDGNGGFTFPAVPPGQYVVHVLRLPRPPIDLHDGSRISVTPGGAVTIGSAVPPVSPPPPPPVPADGTLCARLPLSVGDADVADMIVPLVPGPRVSGRVEFEGTSDRPAGAALTGIRINLDPADGSRMADPTLAFQAGRPDEDGSFRTFGVPPGKYILRANPPAGWFLKGAFLGGADLADVPFDLSAKDVAGVVLAFTDRPASLTGSVRAGQAADPGAVVLAFSTDTSAWSARGEFPRRMRTARAEQDGSYTMNAIVPGEYYVVAVREEAFADWQDPALLEALTRVARQVRIVEADRRTQDLTTAVIR